MTIEVTDRLIYLFAGESEITASDAHAIGIGLKAVFAELERDYVSRWGYVYQENIPAELIRSIPEVLDHLKTAALEQARYMGATIPDIETYETYQSDSAFMAGYVTLKWKIRRD